MKKFSCFLVTSYSFLYDKTSNKVYRSLKARQILLTTIQQYAYIYNICNKFPLWNIHLAFHPFSTHKSVQFRWFFHLDRYIESAQEIEMCKSETISSRHKFFLRTVHNYFIF